MKRLPVDLLEHILILILAALTVVHCGIRHEGSRKICPPNLQDKVNECMFHYSNHMNGLAFQQQQNFYSGVDVETLRSMCTSLRKSIICSHDLKENCPASDAADIETVIFEVYSVVELCSVHNLYEVYSRHQSCFHRMSAYSEACYQTFRASVNKVHRPAMEGNQAALTQYCNELSEMSDCISRRVRISCGDEAAELVQVLVRPSVELSYHCINDTHTTSSSESNDEEKHSRSSNMVEKASQVSKASTLSPQRTLILTSALLMLHFMCPT